MAKMRGIKPEFWDDEELAECSPRARLFYIGLWNFSDDNGVFKWSEKRLKVQIFPYENEDVCDLLEELRKIKKVIPFLYKEEKYGFIPNFKKHQKIDSRYLKVFIDGFTIDFVEKNAVNTAGPQRALSLKGSEGEGEGRGGGVTRGRKKFNPPALQEVKDYFSENGYKSESAEKAWKYYNSSGWKDSKGNQVLSWKQKMISVWFKDENKAPQQLTKEQEDQVQKAMRGEIKMTPELKELKEIYLNKRYG